MHIYTVYTIYSTYTIYMFIPKSPATSIQSFFYNNIINWLDWKMYEFIELPRLLIVCVNIDNLIIPYLIISMKII